MSKIGRKPIALGDVHVEVNGSTINFKGKKSSGSFALPQELSAVVENKTIKLNAVRKTPDINRIWGLNRALLANEIKGADKGFEKQVKIVGLGFKASADKNGLQLTLGYSHKINFPLPSNITVDIDKTGQLLTFKSSDKELLGQVCSQVRAMRLPEPYKGTGVQYAQEVILRKAGKAKAA